MKNDTVRVFVGWGADGDLEVTGMGQMELVVCGESIPCDCVFLSHADRSVFLFG